MSRAEQDQGRALCSTYVARVCLCGEKDPSFKDECQMGKGLEEGLNLYLALLRGAEGELNVKERTQTEHGARKIIQQCVKRDAALDPQTCPRP